MGTLSRLVTRAAATMSAVGLLAVGLTVLAAPAASADVLPTVPAPIQQRSSDMVTSDSLPTVQIDSGVVWTQVVVGNTVYAGGSFSNTRPAGAAPGTNLTPRGNLLAYNITTGNLITSFAPNLNGAVKALAVSPDGTRLYVGGSFQSANGQTRWNLATYNTATGELISTFRPSVGGTSVNAIVATNTTVYVGGQANAGNSVQRYNLMAFSASDGALLNWAPRTDRSVDAMVMDPTGQKLIIGGRFGLVNNLAQRGLAALDLTTGAMLPWAAPQTVINGVSTGPDAGKAGIWALAADATGVYGTGWVFANKYAGNLEGGFAAEAGTGDIRWVQDCHGDHYGVYSNGAAVYMTGHPHACETVNGFPQASPPFVRYASAFTIPAKGTLSRTPHVNDIYADWSGVPAPAMYSWYPDFVVGTATGQYQAGWNATGNSNYVVIGGEFPIVNGLRQQGLARFAVPSIAPDKQGPRLAGADWTPTGLSVKPGTVRLSIPANWDRDDQSLTYRVIRNGNTAQPVAQTTTENLFWQSKSLSFTDSGLTPGATYSYRVVAVDPDGNSVNSATIQVTVTNQTMSAYASTVLDDEPTLFWRLSEPTNSPAAFDWAGTTDGSVGTGVTRQESGAVIGDTDRSSRFDGTENGSAVTPTPQAGPNVFTAEAWINTTTTAGGKILGFGGSKTGMSGSYDRHVYMTNDGQIAFGVYTGATETVTSATPFNDGQWHHIIASMGPEGMRLTIDGILIGTNGTTTGQPFDGFWRVGSDNLGGWPNQPSSNSFNGLIDDVAIYPTVLTRQQIVEHYTTAGYTLNVPQAPADAYGAAVYASDPALYWRLADQPGSNKAADSGTYLAPGNVGPSVTFGQQGSAGIVGTAASFNGGAVVSSQPTNNPTVYTEVAWFKTTTGSGGKIIGFGDVNNPAATSNNYDRHVYLQDDGRLIFGTWNNGATTLSSPGALNDGQWHMVAASQGPEGMRLYIDGALVSENSTATAQAYNGFWRIGGDTTWGSSTPWFNGSIDDAAVWARALPAQDVAALYQLGIGGRPTAAFVADHVDLTTSVDAATSSAVAGRTLAQYSWNWGDGSAAGSGATASHAYQAAGTYTITLTVTDNRGATATETHQVTVTAPHLPPTAVIASTATSLSVAFSSTGSTTTDGSTATGWAWTFGDGTSSIEQNPVHAYSASGTYTVKLVVTDSMGAASTAAEKEVTVTHVAPVAAFTATTSLLTVNVDGTSSTTSDGATKTYDWNWGDSSPHATTATASHLYAAPGTYLVSLKVTDGLGASTTRSEQVTVTEHAAPVPSFAVQNSFLQISVDASATTASDGAVLSYSWNWGDATGAGTGVSAQHTYAAAGTYTVTLTATDSLGATATKTADVTVAAHQAPVPAFTSAPTNLAVAVNASGSTASDGATLTYDWNWGDSTAHSTGVTATHTYAAPGTYTVTLTVTDSLGATGTSSSPVTVTAPASTEVATDLFERTVAAGWGTATVGGPWSGAAGLSVAGGKGVLTVAKGSTRAGTLTNSSALDTDTKVDLTLDKVADGGGAHFSLVSRRTAAGEYWAKIVVSSTGVVTVSVARIVGTTETRLVNQNLAGTYVPGTVLHVRMQTIGSGTTQLKLKVWPDGQAEPAAWTASAADTTAQLQTAGTTALSAYVSASATNGPVKYTVDNLSVQRPQ